MRMLLLAAVLCTGCTGMAGIVKELAKDPASACVQFVAGPAGMYGTGLMGRSNSDGVGVVVENGRCAITPAAK